MPRGDPCESVHSLQPIAPSSVAILMKVQGRHPASQWSASTAVIFMSGGGERRTAGLERVPASGGGNARVEGPGNSTRRMCTGAAVARTIGELSHRCARHLTWCLTGTLAVL